MAPDPEALAALREAWNKIASMPAEPVRESPDPRAPHRRGVSTRAKASGSTGDVDPDSGVATDSDSTSRSDVFSEGDPRAAAREIALRRLSVRARSRKELAQDLKSRDISAEVADELLNRFAEVGLINDAAFAEEWVESRGRRSGAGRLRQELRLKGVDEEHIAEAIGGREDEDLTNARDLAVRKAASMKGLDAVVRQRRLTAFLGRRGFSNAVIRRVVGEVLPAEVVGDEG